ncbi:MAG: electron transport complex subunit E [Candidatus Eremiobacteraeota bacterium]|nr:electron transport complex subunit E [Candidatus Eremiobacteraeota bacterium]
MFGEMWKTFKNGLWEENAVFALALGLCPALAVTTSASNGLGMGIALLFVLAMSVLILSLVRHFIDERVRVPFFLAVIAGFVTITDMTMKAYFPPLAKSLGLYVPLIVVNCTVLGRVEVFASKTPPHKAFADGLGMGVGFTIALIVLGGIRELLGNGTIFNMPLLSLIPTYKPVLMMILPPGGFILVGLLMGAISMTKKAIMKSQIAKAKGVLRDDIVPPPELDEITHAELAQKPY